MEWVTTSAASHHNMAVDNLGNVWTWGMGAGGRLGHGDTTSVSNPTMIQGLSGIISVSGGAGHSMALDNSGRVWTWGLGDSGRLGHGSRANEYSPRQVTGLSNITDISAGYRHSVALDNQGRVWTWGYTANGVNEYTPVMLSARYDGGVLPVFVAIDAGRNFSAALCVDGRVWTWGYGGNGRLGHGDTISVARPRPVANLNNVTMLSVGLDHMVALGENGEVFVWGSGSYGQLNGSRIDVHSPMSGMFFTDSETGETIRYMTDMVMVTAGDRHTVAVCRDGRIWVWGAGSLFGVDREYGAAGWVDGLRGVESVTIGGDNLIARDSYGWIWTWGSPVDLF